MKIILMYDLMMDDAEKIKQYNRFHNWIVKRGYTMIQYSIYAKTINAVTKYEPEIKSISKIVPNNGNVRIMVVTERQYFDMRMLQGSRGISETVNDERRYLKIDENIWE